MNAGRAALFVGLLLAISGLIRSGRMWRDIVRGTVNLRDLIQIRFELLSAGMLILLSSALP